ncbi:MAG TPA: hypothetical protein PL080_06780 [Candidatus Syntrophosphaera thermopropionivorans]|jgi:hypothetical protein|nr:hypothetical protein [Candidatus Syntrophosphaera thermopropionivorans]
MCNEYATSKEHVPAKCFFPENPTTRVNLITVRSCKAHNEDSSNDDQYTRDVIVMSAFGSYFAKHQFNYKTHPCFLKQPGYLKLFLQEVISVATDLGNTKAFQIDRKRFDRTIKKYAYGLYFNTYKTHWERDLSVATDHLYEKSSNGKELVPDDLGIIIREFKSEHWPLPDNVFNGSNQDVFKYCFIPLNTSSEDSVLLMVFYNTFDIWVVPGTEYCIPKL